MSVPREVTLDRNQFLTVLQNNKKKIIFKFGADWCGPCKKAEPIIRECCEHLPSDIQVYMIDVDESFDLYAYLNSKKIVKSIPTLLCYDRGNLSYAPDNCLVGGDRDSIIKFFMNAAK